MTCSEHLVLAAAWQELHLVQVRLDKSSDPEIARACEAAYQDVLAAKAALAQAEEKT